MLSSNETENIIKTIDQKLMIMLMMTLIMLSIVGYSVTQNEFDEIKYVFFFIKTHVMPSVIFLIK